MNNKILILGDGLLGTELRKQTNWDYISRKKDNIDFTNLETYCNQLGNYDQIVNCIAYTKTYNDNKEKHWNTNFAAVCDLVDLCKNNRKKLVHISTDYIYAGSKTCADEDDVPVHCRNWYGYTKLLADGYIRARCLDYLLIRTSFKLNPWPYDNAITTQIGNFDYIDKIAGLIIQLINKNACGVFNVGTEIKTIYDLAERTEPYVEPSNKILHETMPENITMDISKMTNFLKKS